jgi:hypothetical protein
MLQLPPAARVTSARYSPAEEEIMWRIGLISTSIVILICLFIVMARATATKFTLFSSFEAAIVVIICLLLNHATQAAKCIKSLEIKVAYVSVVLSLAYFAVLVADIAVAIDPTDRQLETKSNTDNLRDFSSLVPLFVLIIAFVFKVPPGSLLLH